MDISRKCPMCGDTPTLTVKENETERLKQLEKYLVYGSQLGLIQDTLSLFTPFEREFLKTGYCKRCQNMLFNFSFDDDYEDEEEIGVELKD